MSSSTTIVTTGLTFYVDPGNNVSYRGENIKFIRNDKSLVENTRVFRNIIDTTKRSYANFSKSTVTNGCLNISNSVSPFDGYYRVENANNVQTLCVWVKINKKPTIQAFLFDTRPGLDNGWISSSSIGSEWTTAGAAMYVNDNTTTQTSVTWANIEPDVGFWKLLTFTKSTPFSTSQLTFCSNKDLGAGLDASLGPVMIYNRILSSSEIQQNYNFFKNRFIDNLNIFPYKKNLIAYFDFSKMESYNPANPETLNNLVPNSSVRASFSDPINNSLVSGSVLKLKNVSTTNTSDNGSAIMLRNFPTSQGITIMFYMYIHDEPAIERTLLHISNLANGMISSTSGIGSDLKTGIFNNSNGSIGRSMNSIAFKDLAFVKNWTCLSFSFSNINITDRLVLFAKASNLVYNCGINVSVGPIMIYDKVLTDAERNVNEDNYHFLRFFFGPSEPEPFPLNLDMDIGYFDSRKSDVKLFSTVTDASSNPVDSCFKGTKSISGSKGMQINQYYPPYADTPWFDCSYAPAAPLYPSKDNFTRTRGTGYSATTYTVYADTYRVACFNPGEKLGWDCTKLPDKIDYKMGSMSALVAPENVVKVRLYDDNNAHNCRVEALKSPNTYFAWGFEPGNCLLYKKEARNGFYGDNFETVQVTGCLNEDEKLEWGCQTSNPITTSEETISSVATPNTNGSTSTSGVSSVVTGTNSTSGVPYVVPGANSSSGVPYAVSGANSTSGVPYAVSGSNSTFSNTNTSSISTTISDQNRNSTNSSKLLLDTSDFFEKNKKIIIPVSVGVVFLIFVLLIFFLRR